MIYIHRDWTQVPDAIKAALQKATEELDAIDNLAARKAYIEKNSSAWTAVREYLLAMSNGKCWYSEAKDSVARYQVDHFRPHGRAKQAAKIFADGYSWLAFDLDNFRLSGMLCNTANREYSEETVGKSDWFPLADPSRRATLVARDTAGETPLLLDPVEPEDLCKLWFNDDGSILPDPDLEEGAKSNVNLAIQYLGLQQSQLNAQRRSAWRNCNRTIKRYKRIDKIAKGDRTQLEVDMLKEAREELVAMSKASSEFAAAMRCCLIAHGLKQLVVRDELLPLALQD
jgi:hypothetical protein